MEPNNNILFYNAIAEEYDAILEKEHSNRIVRQHVAEIFMNIVNKGWVLDFGGGTGMDMEWLINNNYNIIFCEPSSGMRKKAMDGYRHLHQDNEVIFLDDAQTDFTVWNERIPFDRQVDAILSNFAVINCIRDLRLLFQQLSLAVRQGGHLIALILNRKQHLIRSLVFGRPRIVQVQYDRQQQTVYLHSEKEIRAASSEWFDFCKSRHLAGYDFSILHLIRK